jgi:hypothetical protein
MIHLLQFINVDFLAGFVFCWGVMFASRKLRKSKIKRDVMAAICMGPLCHVMKRLDEVLDKNL